MKRSKYVYIRYWLAKNHGRAYKCEHCNVKKSPKFKVYQWVLKRGKEEKRDVKNYLQLCARCLAKYKPRNSKYNFPRDCYGGTKQSRRRYKKRQNKIYYSLNREKIDNNRRKYYRENKDYFIKHGKEYRIKNKVKIKAKRKKYYLRNKEKIRKRMEIYNKKNRKKVLKRMREYYHKNKNKSKNKKITNK